MGKNKIAPSLFNPKGAGRPRGRKTTYVPRVRRPAFRKGIPLHITLKRSPGLANLRNKIFMRIMKRALLRAREKGLFVVAYTIQSNHLHLFVETVSVHQLKRGMKALTHTLLIHLKKHHWSQRVNGPAVPFFSDRYHLVLKTTPTEVKNLLRYILTNTKKHMAKSLQTLGSLCPFTFCYHPGAQNTWEEAGISPPRFWLTRSALPS